MGPNGSKRFRLPGFSDSCHMKLAMLSALCTSHLYPPGEIPWYSFLLKAESTPGTQFGQNDSVKCRISEDLIGNRTHNLPSCNTVPQQTALLRTPRDHSAFSIVGSTFLITHCNIAVELDI